MSVLASSLLDAYDRGVAIAPPSQAHSLSLAAAYDIAGELIGLRRRRGERMVGRKIGFSNRAIWPVYGVHGPIWGAVWNSTLVQLEAGTEATVSLAGLLEPRLEPEIVLGLASAPRSSALPELARSIEWVAHGFEIVQSLCPGWRFAAADTVATFGLHARLIVGPRVSIDALGGAAGLAETLARATVALECDARLIETGCGANALDGPLQALGFLVDTLGAQPTLPPLAAGELVSTGTLTDAQPLAPGQVWRSTIEGAPLTGLSLRVTA